ncbi:hypothetical protein ElyMa_002738900 [Elysia marginata]|uniref:Uncharacterized protein n=1 Tax=Elysia marginata TaxID=1093978 RepID=A0AAV4HK52_9GAST|nr:hypothetical protein ElyMa_002738900 [Elysia marginata]
MGQLTSRQEMLSMEVTEPYMRNWLCANMAFRESSQAISVYLHRSIAQIHKRIQRSISSSSLCRINCSKQEQGNGLNRWCPTCERWAMEIQSLCESDYREKIKFSHLNSSQWPINPYEVVRAFIPKAHRLYYKAEEFHEDLRFGLSFIENCKEFSVPKHVCERVWQVRGRVKRKNVRMRLSRQQMEETIQALLELLSYLDIGDDNIVINKLETLLQRDVEDGNEGCVIM